jgi:hypothetical protein
MERLEMVLQRAVPIKFLQCLRRDCGANFPIAVRG